MMYSSWDLQHNRVFCHFGPFFALWPSQQPKKSKVWKNEKKPGNMNLQLCITNDDHKMYGSWDIEHDRKKKFFFWSHFLPFYPTNNSKNPNFEKMIKKPEITIILHLCTTKDNCMMCGSWNIGHDSDFGLFFALLPPQQLQKSKFWKNEKTPRDIIISNRCAIYENHIMFSPWDMEHDRQNIWSLWTIFCPLTSLTTWKIKILNKRKKPLEISFYTSVAKIVIIWYTVPEIWHVKDVVCFSFWAIFCSFTSPPSP